MNQNWKYRNGLKAWVNMVTMAARKSGAGANARRHVSASTHSQTSSRRNEMNVHRARTARLRVVKISAPNRACAAGEAVAPNIAPRYATAWFRVGERNSTQENRT